MFFAVLCQPGTPNVSQPTVLLLSTDGALVINPPWVQLSLTALRDLGSALAANRLRYQCTLSALLRSSSSKEVVKQLTKVRVFKLWGWV